MNSAATLPRFIIRSSSVVATTLAAVSPSLAVMILGYFAVASSSAVTMILGYFATLSSSLAAAERRAFARSVEKATASAKEN